LKETIVLIDFKLKLIFGKIILCGIVISKDKWWKMIDLDKRDIEIIKKIKHLNYIGEVDEAGAGCLAGNLVVAAVILDKNNTIEGLNDSKKLTEKKRNELFPVILEKALDYCIIVISSEEIDASNIYEMRMEGMRRAIKGLKKVEHALIDGNKIPKGITTAADYIIKGDLKTEGIAAASILAKVTRDNQIKKDSLKYPEYSFDKHKGYGTKLHNEALIKHGPCEIHRMSYKPVRASMSESQIEKWISRIR
jgi:ribonuclease HII